jgi:tight adherence protein C
MTLLALIALLLIGVSLASVVWAIVLPHTRADARLKAIDAYGYTSMGDTEAKPVAQESMLRPFLERIGTRAAARLGQAQVERLREQLLSAGLHKLNPQLILGYQLVAVGAGVFFGLATDPLGIPGPILDTLVLAAAGWVLPTVLIQTKARSRLAQIDRQLPDLIDLLVVMIEAGSGFGGALADGATKTPGPLGEELKLTLSEQRFGLSQAEAMENLLTRIDTPNMRSFVKGINQGESLGVSVGAIMRGLANEMRLRRKASAEERAQRAPVKMLFPLIFCIFPALGVVILGPAVIGIADAFGS